MLACQTTSTLNVPEQNLHYWTPESPREPSPFLDSYSEVQVWSSLRVLSICIPWGSETDGLKGTLGGPLVLWVG